MSDWYQVSSDSKPAEFDSTSSKVCVYQRKNIVQSDSGWLYDERKLSFDEFQQLRIRQLEEELTQMQLALVDMYERSWDDG